MVAHLPTRPRGRIALLLLWTHQTHGPVGRVLQEISMCSNIPDAHEPNSVSDRVPLGVIASSSLRVCVVRRAWAARLIANSAPGSEPMRRAVHSILLQHPFAPGSLDTEFPPKGQIRARGNHDGPSLLSVLRAGDGSSKRRTEGAESVVTMLINKTTA